MASAKVQTITKTGGEPAVEQMLTLVQKNRAMAVELNVREARLEERIEEVCALLTEERKFLRSVQARRNRVARRTGLEL